MEGIFKNDKSLISAIKKGDKSAYAILFNTYYNKLCTYAYALAEDGKKAEDLTQDVLLKFWLNRKNLKIKTSLNAYLYKSVHNAYLDLYKKEQRSHKLVKQLQMEAVIEFEETDKGEKEKKLARLHSIISNLPEKRQEIFILNKLQNLKYKEIAKLRNISERTVESQIRTALITIRKAVSKES